MAVRMAVFTVISCALFFALGKRAPSDFLAIMIGSSIGIVLMVPMGISRDKMEGTLDFICGLPVEPRAIAGSRFIAVAILAVPWAVATGAVAASVPQIGALNPLGVTVLMWLAMLLLGACGTALMTQFGLETLFGAPLLAMVITLVLLPRVVRALVPGITQEALLRFLQQPAAPYVIAAALVAAVGIVGAVAFAATARGFAGYRPDATSR
jgi:hypothetical protein